MNVRDDIVRALEEYDAFVWSGAASEVSLNARLEEIARLVPHAQFEELYFSGDREWTNEELADEALRRERLWEEGGEIAVLTGSVDGDLRFTAVYVALDDDGYATQLAFADRDFEPRCFLLISHVNAPTDQDVMLGLDGLFVEGPNLEGYDLVKGVTLEGCTLRVELENAEAGYSRVTIEMSEEDVAALCGAGEPEGIRGRIRARSG